MAIRNLIFDLGGVLLDIDFNKTKEAFEAQGFTDFNDYYQQSYSSPFFSEFEQGRISPASFYEGIRSIASITLSDAQIEQSWNALLLDFRKQSIAYLATLRKDYPVFLLSNTNAAHHEEFTGRYRREFSSENFDENFDKAYYSHIIQLVKPGPESYLHITKENGLDPAETLFIDDTLKNIEGAKAVGMQTLHLQKGQLIEEMLPKILG
jgi:HAD superfamily hydrolase (TIGR01509 family)